MANYELYTDGSCIKNPGPGGWAFILLENGKTKIKLSHGHKTTTNNRMELLAIINGLSYVPRGSKVTLYSDSKYALDVCFNEYKCNANEDLINLVKNFKKLLEIEPVWVKAHKDNKYNNECDELARKQAKMLVNA